MFSLLVLQIAYNYLNPKQKKLFFTLSKLCNLTIWQPY